MDPASSLEWLCVFLLLLVVVAAAAAAADIE